MAIKRRRPDDTHALPGQKLLGGPALPVTEEAVTAYRELAAASPDRYRPDLARSLGRLAEILASLGRADEAEEIRQDAAN